MFDILAGMVEPIARVMKWPLIWGLVLSLGLGCGSSLEPGEREELIELEQLQAEIDGLVEASRAAEPLPTLPRDDLEELEIRMHRKKIADDMRLGVAEAMTPLAFAAALFAPEGAVDLLLAVMPVHRIGDAAAGIAQTALKARRRSKRAKELARLSDEFHAALSGEGKTFLRLADSLQQADLRALRSIYDRTKSSAVVTKLMNRQVIAKDADVAWIARKLERGRMDKDLVERFTFDAGVVEDITLHDSSLSWATLQRVVEGAEVDPKVRAALAGKVQGLMGERAARDIVRSAPFMRRHLKRVDDDVASGQGVHYGYQYSGQRSIDIMALSKEREAIFVEVKTWSSETWAIPGQTDKIIEQLSRHNDGIKDIMWKGDPGRTVAARVLMVEESGFKAGLEQAIEDNFRNRVTGLGWVIETIPASDVRTFSDLIDSLR